MVTLVLWTKEIGIKDNNILFLVSGKETICKNATADFCRKGSMQKYIKYLLSFDLSKYDIVWDVFLNNIVEHCVQNHFQELYIIILSKKSFCTKWSIANVYQRVSHYTCFKRFLPDFV